MKLLFRYKKKQLAICRLLFLFSFCFLFSTFLFCQKPFDNSGVSRVVFSGQKVFTIRKGLEEKGLVEGENSITLISGKFNEVAIGPSIIHEKLSEGYDYTPLFFTARFPIYQFQSRKKGQFTIIAEPQFVLNNASPSFPTTFEFGINVGFQYFLSFSQKNGLSASISAGPHYLSLETQMQAKGFIFSDNFEIGYYQLVNKKLGISIKPRFRHISNAGFQSPNIGIDNFFLMVGFFWGKPLN